MEDAPDFGKCPCTMGRLQPRHIDIRLKFRGRTLIINGVLQGKCGQCGTTVYRPQTLARLETIYLEGRAYQEEDTP